MFQISKKLVEDLKYECVKNKEYIEAHYLRKLEQKEQFQINPDDFNNYERYVRFNTLFCSVILSLN